MEEGLFYYFVTDWGDWLGLRLFLLTQKRIKVNKNESKAKFIEDRLQARGEPVERNNGPKLLGYINEEFSGWRTSICILR